MISHLCELGGWDRQLYFYPRSSWYRDNILETGVLTFLVYERQVWKDDSPSIQSSMLLNPWTRTWTYPRMRHVLIKMVFRNTKSSCEWPVILLLFGITRLLPVVPRSCWGKACVHCLCWSSTAASSSLTSQLCRARNVPKFLISPPLPCLTQVAQIAVTASHTWYHEVLSDGPVVKSRAKHLSSASHCLVRLCQCTRVALVTYLKLQYKGLESQREQVRSRALQATQASHLQDLRKSPGIQLSHGTGYWTRMRLGR